MQKKEKVALPSNPVVEIQTTELKHANCWSENRLNILTCWCSADEKCSYSKGCKYSREGLSKFEPALNSILDDIKRAIMHLQEGKLIWH